MASGGVEGEASLGNREGGAEDTPLDRVELGRRLQACAEAGQDVCPILSMGADPTWSDREGRTALHWASMNGHMLTTISLAAFGADLNARTNNGRTALHGACWNGHTQVALQLIEMGANPHVKSTDGSTPLMDAARNNHADTVTALVTIVGSDVGAWEKGGRTALHFAALNGHTETVKALVDIGADVNVSDADGSRPLHFASWNGHLQTVRMLVLLGANQEHRDIYSSTALHDAALSGRTDTASLLIDFRADVDARNNRGITPLHSAASSGHEDTVELLISRNADVNVANDDGRTALHFATWNNHPRIVFLLLRNGADMYMCSEDGIHSADVLCEAEFDWPADVLPHLHSLRLPQTPMHTAARKGDCVQVQRLAGSGVDVNCPNNVGDTPLHWAVRATQLKSSVVLIELGGDVLRSNDMGRSVYEDVQVYMDRMQQECIKLKARQQQDKTLAQAAHGTSKQRGRSQSPLEDFGLENFDFPAASNRKKARLVEAEQYAAGDASVVIHIPSGATAAKPLAEIIPGSPHERVSSSSSLSGASHQDCGNPDFPSDCNPDDVHNIVFHEGAWSAHPVRNACMQVEAWVSHIPGVRTWQLAKNHAVGIQSVVFVLADVVSKPLETVTSVSELWSKRARWAHSVVQDVTGAALHGDAKGVVTAVRKVPLVEHVVQRFTHKAGEWNKRWHYVRKAADDLLFWVPLKARDRERECVVGGYA